MPAFTSVLKDVVRRMNEPYPGLDTYPIFDETYRPDLNQKIVDHFWNQEIGLETPEMFRFNMRRKMNEIMPYYNQMYESTKIQFDPLATIDLSTLNNRTTSDTLNSNGTTNTNGNTTSQSRIVNSEFPQTNLAGNEDYASTGTDSTTAGTTTGANTDTRTQTNNGTDAVNSTVTGFQGVASELLMRYRASLINVDMMVIAELDELFMSVWNNGDSYFDQGYFL